MEKSMGSVVVVGGSVAGLLAAAVIAPHATRVTILDRDGLPDEAVPRRGVPQGVHVHALLPGGARIAEELLPGIGRELAAAGSPVLQMGNDVTWVSPAGAGVPVDTDLELFTGTRPLLERVVRTRVLDLPGIEAIASTGVRGLVVEGGAVRGVRLDTGDIVPADVVVDATGRASRSPEWLRAAGYDAPAETIIDADLGYASQILTAPADVFGEARGAYVQIAFPEHLRGGIAFPIERGRFMLTLLGTAGDRPPRDPEGFAEFARSLRDPMLAELLATGTPEGPISVFGATANRFRHYERLRRLPAGFIATGDAACAFNPVYGQGMSAAAMAAMALRRCVATAATPAELTRAFPAAFRTAVKLPWMLATAADLDAAGVRPPLPVRAMNRYVACVMGASTWSPRARRRLLEVMGLTKGAGNLFKPGVVADVVRDGRRDRRSATSPAPAIAPATATPAAPAAA